MDVILATSATPPFLVETATIIVAGALIAYIGYRLGLVPIVGFLLAGVVIGPHALGLVQDRALIDAAAEVGVILLLFTIGIEFSLEKLSRIQRLIFGGGGLQVILATGATAGLLALLGVPWPAGVFTGFLVTLSSTAIVLKLLDDRGQTSTAPGQVSLGLLIFQDFAIIVMVLLLPMLAGMGGSALEILWALTKAGLVIAAVLLGARRLMPPLLERVARTCSQELFLLTLIALCFGTAYLTSLVGVSVALGAFLAGLVVSESRFSEHAFGEIMPLQILFAASFFISVGMLLDLQFLVMNLPLVLGVVAVVLLIKVVTTGLSVLALGYAPSVALASALVLAQVGEFSFVLERAGRELGLYPAGLEAFGSQVFVAASVLLMVLTPPLCQLGFGLARRMEARRRERPAAEALPEPSPEPSEEPVALENHVLVAGYGHAARRLVRVLREVEVPHVVVTLSPPRAQEAEAGGTLVVRGDVARRRALELAGIDRAKLMIIPGDDLAAARRVAAVARTLNPTMQIVTRTRYAAAVDGWEGGADRVFVEELETVVQLFTEVLRGHQLEASDLERYTLRLRRDGYRLLRAPSGDGKTLTPLRQIADQRIDTRTVRIREGAAALGQRITELPLSLYGLTVRTLCRGGEMVPGLFRDERLQVGDELELSGSADAFAASALLFRTPPADEEIVLTERVSKEDEADDGPVAPHASVRVYGADWCPLTGGFRAYLTRQKVPFEYVDLEEQAWAEDEVRAMNGGQLKFPMVVVGQETMKNPPIDDLEAVLSSYGLLETEIMTR